MKRHIGWVLAFGVMVSLLLSACAPAAVPTPTPTAAPKVTAKPEAAAPTATSKPAATPPTKELAKVKIGSIPSLGMSDYYVANAKGYFKEEGIEVEFVDFPTGSEMIPAVATGQVDVGGTLGLNEGFFNAIKSGIPLRIVATQSLYTKDLTHNVFVVRKDLVDSGRWKDWSSLKGLTFNWVQRGGGISTVQMGFIMKKYGLTLNDFTGVYLPHQAQVVAFTNKALDAGIMLEPNATPALEQGDVVSIGRAVDVVPEAYLGGIVLYSPGFAEGRAELARGFMVAKLKGARDYIDAFGPKRKNTDEIIQILVKASPVKDPQLYRKMIANKTMPGLMPDGTIQVAQVQLFHDSFLQDGFLKEKVDFQKALDNRFAEYALSKLGKYQ